MTTPNECFHIISARWRWLLRLKVRWHRFVWGPSA